MSASPAKNVDKKTSPCTVIAFIKYWKNNQTMNHGFLPIQKKKMSSQLFPWIPITIPTTEHPRNKQLIAQRLAIAGLSVAYQKSEFC